MSDWLAIGDETGNWDELHKLDEFFGVALVIGRIEDWQGAFQETLDGQRIQERLQAPPEHLPAAYRKSSSHHLMDAFNYWKTQPLEGVGSLREPGPDPLRQEVFATLRWLAEHPRLITLGLWFKGLDGQRELFRSGDPAVALGRAYGLLVGLALPFLNRTDCLLVQPGLRSEPAYSLAQQRATVAKEQKKADARSPGDTRSTVSVLIEEGQRHRNAWRGDAIAHFEAGTLDHLRGLCSSLKKTYLDNYVANAIADLGAGLLRLSCQPGPARFGLRRDPAWNNVVFHSLEEMI